MTVVIGNRLSDASAGRPASAASGGPDRAAGTAGFGHALDDAGKRQAKNPAAGAADEKPADKPAVVAAGIAFAREPSPEGLHTKKSEHRSGKTETDEATDGDEKSEDAETAGQPDAPAPLRDRAPLLAALNELGQRNTAGPTGDTGAKPQSPGTDAAPPGTLAGPAHVVGTSASAKGRPPATAGPGLPDTAAGESVPISMPGKAAGDGTARPGSAESTTVADAAPTPDPATEGDRPGAVRPGRAAGKETAREPETADRGLSDRRTANTVTVTHERSFPAPAAPAMSPAASRVVEALAAGARPVPQPPVPASPAPTAVALPTHMLKIELHPAELGVVTASLRLSGGQLSVELKPETTEAYRRLSADADTIASSLKKLGFDVDTVSIMQPAVAVHAVARADAGSAATAAMPGRDNPQFQSGTSGGNAGNSGGQQPGRNDGHEKAFERPAPTHRERAGGSLFI
jgi:chemotaxis protein MotD